MIELTPEFLEQYVTASDREQISFSRRLTPSEKLRMGPMLYDREFKIVERMIRDAFPDATDNAVTHLAGRVMGWYHGAD